MKNVERFLKEIKVFDCNLTKTRIGNRHDGGYIALREPCELTRTVFSFGIDDDVGFELDFVSRFPGAYIKLFDPTIKSLPHNHKRFAFWDLGVGPGHVSLEEIMICVGEVAGTKMLKMDIEWDEWGMLLDTDDKTLGQFSQLLIEFHVVSVDGMPKEAATPYFQKFYKSVYDKINDDLFDMYYRVMKKLNDQFFAIHVHVNNSLAKTSVDGFGLPPLIEMSFIRKDLVGSAEMTKATFPVKGLDFPNKTDRPDITWEIF